MVTDSRSPRDGRYIEKIGTYNPLTNPVAIELDFDKALGWLQNGALPSDTCRAILSYKGVLMKKHLLEGVKKGAFDEAEASRRFEEWMKQKEAKIELKRSGLEKSKDDEIMKKLAAEKKINEDRAAKLAKKQAELAAKLKLQAQPEAQDAEPVEDQVAEPPAEAQATESAETQVTEPAVEETNAPVEDKQDQQASEEVKPQE